MVEQPLRFPMHLGIDLEIVYHSIGSVPQVIDKLNFQCF